MKTVISLCCLRYIKKKKKYAETRLNDKIHAQHKKNAFMPYANSEDPDEHAHPVQSDLDILFVDM